MVGGGRFTQGGSTQIVFPAVADLTDNEIDARQPINIPAENNLEGTLVIDIQNRNNQITNIEFSYLTKRIRQQIRFNELQIRQL